MFMKKFFCLVVLVGILTACGSEVQPPQERVFAEARERNGAQAADDLTVRGVVESAESRNVYSTLGFFVERVYAEVGDTVTEGQVLAVLDIEDLELLIAQQRVELETLRQMSEIIPPQRRAELSAARQQSQNALRQSNRMLDEAYSNLQNNTNIHILAAENALTAISLQLETLQTDHENLRVLYEAGTLPGNDLRLSETALEQTKSAHSAALSTLEATRLAAQNEIEMLRDNLTNVELDTTTGIDAMEHAFNLERTELFANLERVEIALQLLERQLDDSVITSPVSGTVTAAPAREGALGAGLMFVVEDTENLRVITHLREYDINRVEAGMTVSVTSDATAGEVHEGTISRINPAAVPGSPIVAFEVEVSIPPATGLRIGMNTRVSIE
jgi:multidrug efflux pump subunit AcrA (membrane-fusion protein)